MSPLSIGPARGASKFTRIDFRVWSRGTASRAGLLDGCRDLVEIRLSEFQIGSIDPAVHLFRASGPPNPSRNSWPAERPRDGNRRHRRLITTRDRTQGVAQAKISFQVRRIKF